MDLGSCRKRQAVLDLEEIVIKGPSFAREVSTDHLAR